MNNPEISIIIANFNNGHYFRDCYNSLIEQTETNWEAIIIDDCSTDNSFKVIEKIISNDKRFKLFKNDINFGYQKTLLIGLNHSNSSIFARLDPDDALQSNAIYKSISTHKQFPNVGLVYSNLVYCDEFLNPISVHKAKQIDSKDFKFLNLNGEISHFASFKKEYYNKTTGINPFIKRAEDQDIYLKMCEIAEVKHIDEELYLYRVHSSGASTNSNIEKAMFWHWVALIKAAERREGLEIESLFQTYYVSRTEYNKLENKLKSLKNSRILKLLYKLGIFKFYKNL